MLSKKKLEEYTFKITSALADVLSNEESENYIDLKEVEKEGLIGELAFALCIASPYYILQQISDIKNVEQLFEILKELDVVLKYQNSKETKNEHSR